MASFSEQNDLFNTDGSIALDRLLEDLHIREQNLLNILGLQEQQAAEEDVRRKLQELVEILAEAAAWAGSLPQAFVWFRTRPIPSFGDQTAAELLRKGNGAAVKSDLARIGIGGYA